MSDPHNSGFAERGQEPFGDILTEQEIAKLLAEAPRDRNAFATWVAHNGPRHLKFELGNGKISVMQAGTSFWHNRICQNLIREIERQIDLDTFAVCHADFAVKTPVGIRYPDILVMPMLSNNAYETESAIFLAEVLSPSSLEIDFNAKLREYSAITGLNTYLIVSQDEPRAWVWKRRADGSWPVDADMLAGRDGSISVAGLDIELSMSAIFRGIPDAPTL